MVEHTSLVERLAEVRRVAEEELAAAGDAAALEQWRIRYLGRKGGALGELTEGIGALPQEERPAAGARPTASRASWRAATPSAPRSCSAPAWKATSPPRPST